MYPWTDHCDHPILDAIATVAARYGVLVEYVSYDEIQARIDAGTVDRPWFSGSIGYAADHTVVAVRGHEPAWLVLHEIWHLVSGEPLSSADEVRGLRLERQLAEEVAVLAGLSGDLDLDWWWASAYERGPTLTSADGTDLRDLPWRQILRFIA